MKDAALLMLCAALLACGAWMLWHFLGKDALTMLLITALIAASVDNARLRRKLRGLEQHRGAE
ncbi:MAG: hypothetical protein ACEQSK_08855 [Sphingomonadaceae bacterium]